MQNLARACKLRKWSGRRDLNPRPSAPQADALPDCATPRRLPLASPRLSLRGLRIIPGSPRTTSATSHETQDASFGRCLQRPTRRRLIHNMRLAPTKGAMHCLCALRVLCEPRCLVGGDMPALRAGNAVTQPRLRSKPPQRRNSCSTSSNSARNCLITCPVMVASARPASPSRRKRAPPMV